MGEVRNIRSESGSDVVCICYGICGYNSNSMMSDNPHSGFYKADTSRTLDLIEGGGYCVYIRREDGADLRSQGMCEHTCTERLQTTTSGDI